MRSGLRSDGTTDRARQWLDRSGPIVEVGAVPSRGHARRRGDPASPRWHPA